MHFLTRLHENRFLTDPLCKQAMIAHVSKETVTVRIVGTPTP